MRGAQKKILHVNFGKGNLFNGNVFANKTMSSKEDFFFSLKIDGSKFCGYKR